MLGLYLTSITIHRRDVAPFDCMQALFGAQRPHLKHIRMEAATAHFSARLQAQRPTRNRSDRAPNLYTI